MVTNGDVMSKAYWIHRDPLSDEVQLHLKKMIGHLSNNTQDKIIEIIEESLGTYIELKKIEKNTPLVKRQKKEIDNIVKLSSKLLEALESMDNKTKDVISLSYQKIDLEDYKRLKFLEQEIPLLVSEYGAMLKHGKSYTYKKVTKNKDCLFKSEWKQVFRSTCSSNEVPP